MTGRSWYLPWMWRSDAAEVIRSRLRFAPALPYSVAKKFLDYVRLPGYLLAFLREESALLFRFGSAFVLEARRTDPACIERESIPDALRWQQPNGRVVKQLSKLALCTS